MQSLCSLIYILPPCTGWAWRHVRTEGGLQLWLPLVRDGVPCRFNSFLSQKQYIVTEIMVFRAQVRDGARPARQRYAGAEPTALYIGPPRRRRPVPHLRRPFRHRGCAGPRHRARAQRRGARRHAGAAAGRGRDGLGPAHLPLLRPSPCCCRRRGGPAGARLVGAHRLGLPVGTRTHARTHARAELVSVPALSRSLPPPRAHASTRSRPTRI